MDLAAERRDDPGDGLHRGQISDTVWVQIAVMEEAWLRVTPDDRAAAVAGQ